MKTAEDWRHVYLSPHFTALECLRSTTADRRGLSEHQYNPPDYVIPNLTHVCGVAESARDFFGVPMIATSGYRSPPVDLAVRGYPMTSHSAHTVGQALDHEIFEFPVGARDSLDDRIFIECGIDPEPYRPQPNFYLFAYYALKQLDRVQQLICEFGPSIWAPAWVHLAAKKGTNRGRITRAEPGADGKAAYRHYTSLRGFLEGELSRTT